MVCIDIFIILQFKIGGIFFYTFDIDKFYHHKTAQKHGKKSRLASNENANNFLLKQHADAIKTMLTLRIKILSLKTT